MGWLGCLDDFSVEENFELFEKMWCVWKIIDKALVGR